MRISDLCTPAMLYFVISIIMLIIGVFTNFNIMTLLIKGFFILVWSWILNFLCRNDLGIISWILVILPFVFLPF